MPALSYPSSLFPSLSSFTVDVPESWQGDPAAGVLFAVRPSVLPEGFAPNMIGTVQRAAMGALDASRQEIDRRAHALNDYEEFGRAETNVGEYRAFHIEYGYRHTETLTLAQMITLVEVNRGAVTDIVQITATCAGNQVKQYWDDFRLMQASLSVAETPN